MGATVEPLSMRVVFTGDLYLMVTPGVVLALPCSPVFTSYHSGPIFWEFSTLLVEGAGKASSLSWPPGCQDMTSSETGSLQVGCTLLRRAVWGPVTRVLRGRETLRHRGWRLCDCGGEIGWSGPQHQHCCHRKANAREHRKASPIAYPSLGLLSLPRGTTGTVASKQPAYPTPC